MTFLRLFLCLAVLMAARAAGQSNVDAGELHGLVTDPSDAAVPGARVTVSSEASGLTRTTLTNNAGEYRLLLLPPGQYEVQFEKEGFRRQVMKGVRVTVGQIAIVDTRLELGLVTELVEVTGAPLLVESERTQQANTLEQELVRNLPINRRDYLAFALLAPGVVDSNALADQADFRVKQTPTSGLSFFGSNGRGNSVTVDGGESNEAGGGVRSTPSQEAVLEFQINRSNYSAELGGATGGVINIVSRSGGNQWHGSLFSFFRHQSMDAGNPFARVFENGQVLRVKPPSQRQQFGASLGGPIRQDRTFFFGSFEGLVRDESAVVSLLNDPSIFGPTPEQQAVLNQLPPAAATPLRAALTSPPSTIELFRINSGAHPFTTRHWRFSTRLDHRLSERDQLLFRLHYSKMDESNADLGALVGASRGLEIKTFDPTALLGWTRTISPRVVNEARVQWNYRGYKVYSREKFGPQLRIQGFGVFNRDNLLPTRTIERRYEMKDNLTIARGRHILKMGGQALVRTINTENHIFFGGGFVFGPLPGALLNPDLPPTFAINSLQAFNLGLAQTFLMGSGNPTVTANYPYYGIYFQDSWKALPNLTFDIGLRYELDQRKLPLPTDKNNIAPRFAFAWDPLNDKKTTVRGGYGIFYAPTYFQADYIVNALNLLDGHRQIAQVFTTIQDPGPGGAHNIFTTLRRQGVIGVPTPTRALTPADLAPFGVRFTHDGPLPPFTVLFSNAADYVSQYSQQASLAIERELARDLSVSIGYTFVRTLKIPRGYDKNLRPAPVDPRLGIRVWSNPIRDFVNPLIAQDNVTASTGRAVYSGMFVEAKKRFSGSFSLFGNYSFSRATDDVVDYSLDFHPADQTNLRAEHALSSFDQRHKLVLYGIWSAPAGLQFSPIFRANSSRPFNLLAGFDLNQDRHDTTDRPAFAGRNTGVGPNFWTFDLRLARKIRLTESAGLEFMGEAFNLFNRLNFSSINNTVGNMPPPFRVYGRHDRTPSEPLGFTGAFDPRRIQLGVRLVF